MRMRIGGTLKRGLGLEACLLRLLAVAMLCAPTINAQQMNQFEATAAPLKSQGSNACANCHEDIWKSCTGNPHSSQSILHGGKGLTCDGCHGPGKVHAGASSGASRIFDPASSTAKEVDEKCMSCHAGSHANSERSRHREGNVSCISCHSIHAAGAPEHLLKMAQPQLCYQCHDNVSAQFSLPFRHKVKEGVMQCTDCHDPHGIPARNATGASARQIAMCVQCHTDTAGPFVYEHADVKAEGCTSCHFPHGGPNPQLLNRSSVNTICQQCHLPSPIFTTSPPNRPAHTPATQGKPCTLCHASIHGSNSSAVFFSSRPEEEGRTY